MTSTSAAVGFVSQLYAEFLHRPADAAGLNYWSSLIDSGALNAAQVSAQFMDSAEFQQNIDPVVRLYFTTFGRAPDPAGLAYWVDAVQSGITLTQIGASFAGAPELGSLHGALDDGAFLDILYQQAFQRAPDAAGKAFYLEQMANGLSRGEVVVAFSGAAEMSDKMGASIKVAEQYLAVQQAQPDAAQIAAGLAGAGSAALFTKLYADDDYSGVVVPFLSRAGVVADGYVKGATVTMTLVETIDGVAVARTVTALTDALGKFDFGDQAGFGALVARGGIDISTGVAVNGSFSASAGSSVINALTTLVQALSADGKHTAAEAATLVKAGLGLDAALDLGSYDPLAVLGRADSSAAAQATALAVKAVLAQIDTATGQVGAVLRGVGAGGKDAGADAFLAALAAALDGAVGTIDLANAGTAAQLLKDAGGIVGASNGQAAALGAIALDAGALIGNLNHAIADAASAAGGTVQSHLIAIASVQVAAATIEAGVANGAAMGNLAPSAAATVGAALANAITNAAALIGDVDGDGKVDAVVPPVVSPPGPVSPAPDVTAPGPVGVLLAPDSDSGVSGDLVTTNTVVTLNLSGIETGATVWLDIDGNGRYDAATDTRATVTGTSATVAADLAPGANSLNVYQQDARANVSAVSSVTVIRDNVAPTADLLAPLTQVQSVTGDDVYSAGDKITFHFSEAVNVDDVLDSNLTASSGHSFGSIGIGFVADNAVNGYATAFTLTLGDGTDLTAGDTMVFPPGAATDKAGNAAGSVSFTLPVLPDGVAPDAPVIRLTSDTGEFGSDKISQSAALTISNQELGAIIEYSLNAGVTWISQSAYTTATTADGSYSVQMRQTDLAGNHSTASAVLAFTKDTLAPARNATMSVTQVQSVSGDGVYSAGDKITLHFSEAVKAFDILTSDLTVSNGHSFGGAGLGFVADNAVNGYATAFTLTLGSGTDLVAGDTLSIPQVSVSDLAGNNATATLAFVMPDISGPVFNAAASTPADNGATGALGENIVLQFNEALSAAESNLAEVLLKNHLGVTVAATATIVGSTVVLNPTANLVLGEAYHVVWSGSAIKDLAGNAAPAVSNATIFNFSGAGAFSGTVAQVNALSGTQMNLATSVTVSDTGENLSAANFNAGNLNWFTTHAQRAVTLDQRDFNAANSIVLSFNGNDYTYGMNLFANAAALLASFQADLIGSEGNPYTASTVTIVGNTLYLAASLGLGANTTLGITAQVTATTTPIALNYSGVAPTDIQTLYLVNEGPDAAIIDVTEVDGRALYFFGVFVLGGTVDQLLDLGLVDSSGLRGEIPMHSVVIDTAAHLVSGGVITADFATIASYELGGVHISDVALSVADAIAIYDALVAGYVDHNHPVPTLDVRFDLDDTALSFDAAQADPAMTALRDAGRFTITGSDGNQDISGSAGADHIEMGGGHDIVRGGGGADVLYGDAVNNAGSTRGIDVFMYAGTNKAALVAESGTTSLTRDVIMDAEIDETLDFTAFMAGRDQSHFQFFGEGAFAGVNATGSAIQVRYDVNQTIANYDVNGDGIANDGTVVGTMVYLDVSDNGIFDGVADMHIVLVGSNINLIEGLGGTLIVT